MTSHNKHINSPLTVSTLALAISAINADISLCEAMRRVNRRVQTRDEFKTFDAATLDSSGVFLVGELERLDPTLHEPLYEYTFLRDINLREDVSIADELSSFTNSTFAAAGGASPSGKSWIGKDATAIAGLALDIGKTAQPLSLWGQELAWTIPELLSAQQMGRPVDSQKFEGLQIKWNMDVDEQVYIGDSTIGAVGICNNTAVDTANVANGASTSPLWANKTADEILADVNTFLSRVWLNSAYAVVPKKLLLPPAKYGYLVAQKVSSAGNMSILEYIKLNNICTAQNNVPLDIQPLKWLNGRGAGGTDRMVAYTNEKKFLRFPLVPLQRTPLEYRGLRQMTTYYGRLGQVEFVYPETIGYADGI